MNDIPLAGAVLSSDRVILGAGLVALAVLLGGAAIASLVRRDRARFGPTTRRLCHAFHLGGADRRLLEGRARGAGVPSAALLISRGCFDAAAAHASPSEARRLAAIRRRVFE